MAWTITIWSSQLELGNAGKPTQRTLDEGPSKKYGRQNKPDALYWKRTDKVAEDKEKNPKTSG